MHTSPVRGERIARFSSLALAVLISHFCRPYRDCTDSRLAGPTDKSVGYYQPSLPGRREWSFGVRQVLFDPWERLHPAP